MTKLFDKLIEKRGITERYLQPKYEDLADPFLLPDMKKAVERLILAAKKGEKVLVYGDYDVDGVTASTEMAEILETIGVEKVDVMLPNRFIDGYGMSNRLVEHAKNEGVGLVVTVDCGSNNGEVIDALMAEGIDVVVTDHHELSGEVPRAAAVVNPKRQDTAEKVGDLRDLCGAGVAFMVARALVLMGKIPDGQEKWWLDLAMIGTICDSMRQSFDNRIICKYGIIVLTKTRRVGLKELMRLAKIKKINTDAVGFQLGPRLNAAGRMKTADLALELLRTKSKTKAAALATELESLNALRKEEQYRAVDAIAEQGSPEDKVIVVEGDWSEGILGIVAGRLVEKYKRPSFVLTETEDGYKGSGRSFGDFNLALACKECQDFLVSGGGHAEACGVKVKPSKLDDFRTAVNQYYDGLSLKNQEKLLDVGEDLRVGMMKSLSIELADELEILEPYGVENTEPVFLLPEVRVEEVKWLGKDEKHLKMKVADSDGGEFTLMAFFAPEEWNATIERVGEKINIWCNLMTNEWQGRKEVEGKIIRLEWL